MECALSSVHVVLKSTGTIFHSVFRACLLPGARGKNVFID